MAKYIDADAVQRWIKTECNPYGKPTIDYETGIKILDYINAMPAADVKPVRHGEWIQVLLFQKFPLRCSVCGYERFSKINMNYCPNCGAKMDEGSEMISVGRYINGISSNQSEWLVDEEGGVMKFLDEDAAKDFLRKNGYTEGEIYSMVFKKFEKGADEDAK